MNVVLSVWKIRIHSYEDVKRLWSSVRSLLGRTRGREHFHEERYYRGLYLLALGHHRLLDYPFQVEQGKQHESPDFMLTSSSGEVTGLEVTKATTQWLQRAMTDSEREYRRREADSESSGSNAEPVSISLSHGGWSHEAEAQWCLLARKAIKKKLKKLPGFRPASRYDLVIYDDTPLPVVNRCKVAAALRPWVGSLDATALKLGRISVVISLDVVFDLGGSVSFLPYIEWNAPKLNEVDESATLLSAMPLPGSSFSIEADVEEFS